MKISLGTTSIDKKNILLDALKELNFIAEVEGYEVNSGITDQPLDEEVTISGAKNRAKEALSKDANADLGLGMEGGLVLIDNNYYLVCASALITKEGKYYLGISSKTQLPIQVSERIKNGEQFGIAIREYSEQNQKNETLNQILNSLISRRESFFESIKYAVRLYMCGNHF